MHEQYLMRVFITACTEPSECFDVFYCYILQNKSITFSLSHTKTVEKEKKNNVLLTEKVQCLKPEKINKMMFFLDTLGKGEEKRFKGKKMKIFIQDVDKLETLKI